MINRRHILTGPWHYHNLEYINLEKKEQDKVIITNNNRLF